MTLLVAKSRQLRIWKGWQAFSRRRRRKRGACGVNDCVTFFDFLLPEGTEGNPSLNSKRTVMRHVSKDTATTIMLHAAERQKPH